MTTTHSGGANDETLQPQASAEAEQGILGAWMKDAGENLDRSLQQGISQASFYFTENRILFLALIALYRQKAGLDISAVAAELEKRQQFNSVGGFLYLMQVESKGTSANLSGFIRTVRELQERRAALRLARNVKDKAGHTTTDAGELTQFIHNEVALYEEEAVTGGDFEEYRLDHAKPPPEPEKRIYLAGKAVCTPGNLTTIIAKAKAGKSAFTGGMVASCLAAAGVELREGDEPLDTFKLTAANPRGRAVVVFDCEQSRYDSHKCAERTLARAGWQETPPWLYQLAVAGLSSREVTQLLHKTLAKVGKKHGGIFLVILDGAADFVDTVNDEAVAEGFADMCRRLAIKYDCPIAAVIHSNEGKMASKDARGWLGKVFIRRAESNLVLTKNKDDVTTVASDQQRNAPITAKDGVAFHWDDGMKRHVSCQRPAEEKKAKKENDLRDLAREAFGDRHGLRYSELCKIICAVAKIEDSTAEKKISEMSQATLSTGRPIIQKHEAGIYQLVP